MLHACTHQANSSFCIRIICVLKIGVEVEIVERYMIGHKPRCMPSSNSMHTEFLGNPFDVACQVCFSSCHSCDLLCIQHGLDDSIPFFRA